MVFFGGCYSELRNSLKNFLTFSFTQFLMDSTGCCQEKLKFSIENNTVTANFTPEEYATCISMKSLWWDEVSIAQKHKLQALKFYFDTLFSNYNNHDAFTWIFPTKDGRKPNKNFLNKVKKVLGLVAGSNPKFQMQEIGIMQAFLHVEVIENEFQGSDEQLNKIIDRTVDLASDSSLIVSTTSTTEQWTDCINPHFVFELLFWIHIKGTTHAGRDTVIIEARQYGYFHGLWGIVQWILQNCSCDKWSKYSKAFEPITQSSTTVPGMFHVDLTFVNGEVILMIVCRMDRVLYLQLLNDKKAATCKNALKKIMERYNLKVMTLYSDNGGEWKGEFEKLLKQIEEKLKNEGKEFKHLQSLPMSPHMNGMIENCNRIKKDIRIWIINHPSYTHEQLSSELDSTASKHNNQHHKTLGMSPLEFKKQTSIALENLKDDNIPFTEKKKKLGAILAHIRRAEANYKKQMSNTEKYRNKGRSRMNFRVGQRVRVSNLVSSTDSKSSLIEEFTKIATITKLSDVTAEIKWGTSGGYSTLQLPGGISIVQRKRLRPYIYGDEKFISRFNLAMETIELNGIYYEDLANADSDIDDEPLDPYDELPLTDSANEISVNDEILAEIAEELGGYVDETTLKDKIEEMQPNFKFPNDVVSTATRESLAKETSTMEKTPLHYPPKGSESRSTKRIQVFEDSTMESPKHFKIADDEIVIVSSTNGTSKGEVGLTMDSICDGFHLTRIPIPGDGNCLFSSLSLLLYGDIKQHSKIRSQVVEYHQQNAEITDMLKQFIGNGRILTRSGSTRGVPVKSVKEYCKAMAKERIWASDIEITSFSCMHQNRIILVFTPGTMCVCLHSGLTCKLLFFNKQDDIKSIQEVLQDPRSLVIAHVEGIHFDALQKQCH